MCKYLFVIMFMGIVFIVLKREKKLKCLFLGNWLHKCQCFILFSKIGGRDRRYYTADIVEEYSMT